MSIAIMASIIVSAIVIFCLKDAYSWNRAPQTLYRFFLLDGKLKLPGFVSTILAANLSLGNFLVFIATWGYQFGWPGIMWFIANLVLNVLGFRLFLRRFKSYIEDHSNNGTIHDYLSSSYASNDSDKIAAWIRISASIVTVTGLVLAIGFELSLAVDLLQPNTALQRIGVFFLLALVICLFTAFGGFRTLVVSDVCQAGLLSLATIALLGFMIFFNKGPIGGILQPFDAKTFLAIGWPSIISICLIGSGWMLVAMDQWQRICASRSYDTSLRGTTIYLFIIACFALVFGAWGMYDKSVFLPLLHGSPLAHHSGGNNPLADIGLLPAVGAPQLLIAFIACGLIAAGISTTNTFLTVASHSLTTDVLVVSLAHRRMQTLTPSESSAFVSVARGLIVTIGALIVLIFAGLTTSQLLTDPLSFFYIAYSVQFALLAPMVMTWPDKSRRPSSGAALLSISLGFLTALVVGYGSWALVQHKANPIFSIPPGDWLTLTPVVTLLVGLIPVVISYVLRRRTYVA